MRETLYVNVFPMEADTVRARWAASALSKDNAYYHYTGTTPRAAFEHLASCVPGMFSVIPKDANTRRLVEWKP